MAAPPATRQPAFAQETLLVAAPGKPGWAMTFAMKYQGTVYLKGRDRRFALEITCSGDASRKVSHTLLLTFPRSWVAPANFKLRMLVDSEPLELEIDGTEDGVMLSDAMFGNQIGLSRESVQRLLEAREIVIEGPPQKTKLPASIAFDAGGDTSARDSLARHCATIGPWAERTGSSSPQATAAPLAPAPQAPPPSAPSASSPVDARAAPAAASGRYLFNVIRNEPYKTAWRALTARNAPVWLQQLDGPAGPSTATNVTGRNFERFTICRAHACDESSAIILFSSDGQWAFAALKDRGKVTYIGTDPLVSQASVAAFFGEPAAPAPSPSAGASAVPSAALPTPNAPEAAAPPPTAELKVEPGSPVVEGVAAVRAGSAVQGFAILKAAAEAGDARAAANVGIMLLKGVGVPRDEKAAFDWLQRAAAAGDPFGSLGVAVVWTEGIGVTIDYGKAGVALRQALNSAAAPEAMAMLIELPQAGLPGKVTPEQAEGERKRLCGLVKATLHRTATVSCSGPLSGQIANASHLAAIEAALRGQSWSAASPVSQLYVPDFFTDTDAILRNRIAHTYEYTRYLARADVKAYLADRGLTLDRPASP